MFHASLEKLTYSSFALVYQFLPVRSGHDLQSAEKTTDNRKNDGAVFSNPCYVSCDDPASSGSHYCSPGNALDMKPEEHIYETISDARSYTNQAAVESEMNNEGVAGKST